MSGERLHNMKAVELRTGLSAHLIRIWERRYGAVTPVRSTSLRRLYTDEEMERLQLLGRLTQSGLAISQIARLPLEELRSLQTGHQPVIDTALPAGLSAQATPMLDEALAAIRNYDTPGLEQILDQGMIIFGYSGLLQKLLIPLLRSIGDAWENGDLTAAQEHAATAAMKDYLACNLRGMSPPVTAPRLLVTTPAGQHHEMGAAIAAGLARKAGWNVSYLGPSLPAEEIAGATLVNSFRAVALSIIYPADDPDLPAQLLRLRNFLPDDLPILVGGRAASGYRAVLQTIGAIMVDDMGDFIRTLDQIRNTPMLPVGPPGESSALAARVSGLPSKSRSASVPRAKQNRAGQAGAN